MKRLWLVVVLGLLVSCSSDVEEVFEEPSIPEETGSVEETDNDELDDKIELKEDSNNNEDEPNVVDLLDFNKFELWDKVIEQETTFIDFRYHGCFNIDSNEQVECRKYDWNFGLSNIHSYTLYFNDLHTIELTQPGSNGLQRDDELLQVAFIGDLVGYLPPSFRAEIEHIFVDARVRFELDKNTLYLPNRYYYENNALVLRDIYQEMLNQLSVNWGFVDEELLESNQPKSLSFEGLTNREILLQIVSWVYLHTIIQQEQQDFEIYQRLTSIINENDILLSNANYLDSTGIKLPPHSYALYVNSARDNIRIATDPSALEEITYIGLQERVAYDRRFDRTSNALTEQQYRVYKIVYLDDDELEFLVNAEIEQEEGLKYVNEVSYFYGQLPRSIRFGLDLLVLQPGSSNIGLMDGGYAFHLDYYQAGEQRISMNHFLVHEIAHVTLDWAQSLYPNQQEIFRMRDNLVEENSWKEAIENDGSHITLYAQQYPVLFLADWGSIQAYQGGEDVADTLVFFIASRLSTERLHPRLLEIWESALSNRFELLDKIDLTLPPSGWYQK